MLQCVAEICSKRRHVRLLCLLGTSCEVSPSAATGGDLRLRGRNLGQEKLLLSYVQYLSYEIHWQEQDICKSAENVFSSFATSGIWSIILLTYPLQWRHFGFHASDVNI